MDLDDYFANVLPTISEEVLRKEFREHEKRLLKRRMESYSRSDAWTLISQYFEQRGFAERQIASYNWFVDMLLEMHFPRIEVFEKSYSQTDSTKVVDRFIHRIEFGKVSIASPMIAEEDSKSKNLNFAKENFFADLLDRTTYRPLLPIDARNKMTYQSNILFDVCYTVTRESTGEIIDKRIEEQVPICTIPVMIRSKICNLTVYQKDPGKSGECFYDPGGYFIISGNDRILIGQEEMTENQAYIFIKSGAGNKNFIVADIRSIPEWRNNNEMQILNPVMVLLKYKIWKGNIKETIKLKPPYNKFDIPITLVFYAYGMKNDKEIVDCILKDRTEAERKSMMEYLVLSINEGQYYAKNTEEAIQYIQELFPQTGGSDDPSVSDDVDENGDAMPKTRIKDPEELARRKKLRDEQGRLKVLNMLNQQLFPHIGMTSESHRAKGLYLGECCYRLLLVAMGRREPDNRDHFSNKRLKLSGPLVWDLYSKVMKACFREMRKHLQIQVESKKSISLGNLLKVKAPTKIHGPFATGNWTHNKNQPQKTGVSSILQRMSYIATMSYSSRANTPIGKEGKLSQPRELGNAQWQRFCPGATPEGEQVFIEFPFC